MPDDPLIADLRARLEETEETLYAIREGEVDAIVVSGSHGDRVFMLSEPDSLSRWMVETMNEAGLAVTPDGLLVFTNTRAAVLLGRSKEQLLAKDLSALVVPADADRFRQLLRTAATDDARIEFVGAAGMPVALHVWASRLDRPQQDTLICLLATDLSRIEADQRLIARLQEQQQQLRAAHLAALNSSQEAVDARLHAEHAAAALELSEQRMQQALQVGHSFTFEWDTSTDTVLRSDSCGQILGLTGEAAVHDTGQRFFQRIHPRDRVKLEQLLQDLTPTSASYMVEYQVMRSDGGMAVLEEVGKGCFDAAGKLQRLVGVTTDISERRRMEAAVLESESRFRKLAESLVDVVWLSDPKIEQMFFMNESYERIWGRSRDSVYASPRSFLDAVHADDRDRVFAHLEGHGHGDWNIEYRIVRPDGEIRWIHDRGFPILNQEGRLDRISGIAADVTERKRTDDLLRAEYDLVVSVTRCSSLQEAVGQCLGAALVVTGMKVGAMHLREDDGGFRLAHSVGLADDFVETVRYFPAVSEVARLVNVGEPVYWRYAELAPMLSDTSGEPGVDALAIVPFRQGQAILGCISVGSPLQTEVPEHARGALQSIAFLVGLLLSREQAQVALSESEERFRLMANASSEMFWCTSPDFNKVLYVSPAFNTIWGRPLEELVTNPMVWFDAIHEDDKPFVREAKANLTQGTSYTIDYRIFRPDGVLRFVKDYGYPIRDATGTAVMLSGTCTDITESKRWAEDLARAKEAAEAANRAKSAFLANMSHEIRTHLNAVLGFAQILVRDPSLTPRQIGMLHTIGRSGRHLLDLINDILDMSKIEAGRLELSLADVCLHDLLDDLEMMFRPRAQAKHLQLRIERDDSVQRYVNADEGKLRQVLINLMSNAVKFTKSGGVAVRVRGETAPGSSVGKAKALRLVIEVEDSGPGIAEDELEYIFEPFRQSATSREAGGTGLGLSVSRRIVELMGGHLMVKSQVGKGSCFRFDVLVKLAEGAPHKTGPTVRQVVGLEQGTEALRILVADDQKDNRDLLVALLVPLGFEIREAVNGQEALDVFEAWLPHAVLMNMRMPILDGYEATRRIKATEKGCATPVIAVTANAFEDAEREVLATGVDNYLHKPFKPEEIFAVLEKCLGLRFVYAADAGQASEKTSAQPLTRADLAVLPEALRQAMHQAIDEGDITRLQALITQVEVIDAETAFKLRIMADRYDYAALTKVLNK
jgi:PAS domain S-box-containing protein